MLNPQLGWDQEESWTWNAHLKMVEASMNVFKKSDCWVCTLFPECPHAGMPVAGIPIPFGTSGHNLWLRPKYTHWNETDLQTWAILNPHSV